MRTRLLVPLALAIFAATPLAFAQTAEDRAQARALGERGAEALANHEWAKAEDLFRRGDALFHAPTLTLGLARAEVQLGKFVEAWEAYHRVILETPSGNNAVFTKAVQDAKAESLAVEGRRAQVTLTLTGPTEGTVTLDGIALPAAAVGAGRFINPGNHTVHVEAAAYKPLDTHFQVAEGQSTSVPLVLVPAPPPPAGAVVFTPPPLGGPPPGSPPAPPPPTGHASHTLSYISFGVGGAGLVTGVVTGVLAMSKHSSLHSSPCATGPCLPGDASTFDSNLNSFHTLGTISTVGFVVAGVGAAAGTLLWFVAPGRTEAAGIAITPYVGLGAAGAVGRF
jgi:hypothetical protein